MLHKETVESSTLDLIHKLMADHDLKAFNLVGGTALALMIGHRISLDIDLFTDSAFDSKGWICAIFKIAAIDKYLVLGFSLIKFS